MYKRLLVLALVAMLSPAVLGDIIVDDHFDDGDIESNTTGIGTGFNYWDIGWSGNVTEADSKVTLNGPVHGGSRASIASKEGATLGADICRFEFQGVNFAVGNTGTGTTARDCVGVKEGNEAWDYDEGLPTGFWIQFENTSLTANDASAWNGTSVLFYESSTDVKTVLATWEFDTLNWDSGTMDLTPVLNITLDLGPTDYSLTIEGDTISNVTGSLSGTYAAAGITNELSTGYATAYIQSENPGIDISIDQIIIIEGAPGPELASLPSPADEAVDMPRDVTLSWTPGEFADTHDVYFGEDFDDVNDADSGSSLLIGPGISQNTLSPGRLEFSQTYFWRIDEVNAPPDSTVFKGKVWSFTVEPLAYPIPATSIIPTASSQGEGEGSENTINNSGLDENDNHSILPTTMWLTTEGQAGPVWIQYEFDKSYKLHEMLVWNYNGPSVLWWYGIKEVTVEYSTDGTNWDQVPDVNEFASATGKPGYASNITVPFDGVAAKYVRITAISNFSNGVFDQYGLSEVRFTYIPTHAREPSPDDEAMDVAVDTTLSWRAGRDVAEHSVYISTDQQTITDGTVSATTVNQASYSPDLTLGGTYYWRVDEVNNTEANPIWQGDLWSFTTQEYLIVDDFESYNDIPEGENGSNLVYLTWLDGYDNPTVNGSTMGYTSGSSLETDITREGSSQSVPLMYDNSVASSSVVTVSMDALDIGRNWTGGGAETLVLWFYGDPNNAATEQMYISIGGKKKIYDGDLNNLTKRRWTQWNVDLAELGINLTNVTTLAIGLERTGAAGGSGTILIDDIRLYKSAPPRPVPTDPGTENLVAYYAMENNVQDSSGNNLHGTIAGGAPSYIAGISAMALSLDGVDDYVDCGTVANFDITEQITLAAWVKTNDAGNGQHNPFVGKGDQSYAIKHASNNSMEFFIYEGGWHTLQSPVDSSFNQHWHHITGTFDGSRLMLYVDGGVVNSIDYTGSIATTTYPINIGRNSQNTDRLYEGAIDEVRIYNRTLTEGEILYLSNM